MKIKRRKKFFQLFFLLNSFLLTNCSNSIVDPKGQIAFEERSLIFNAFLLMLIVILPVIFLTLFFVLKYKRNRNSKYDPSFLHSAPIELIVWIIPICIISILGYFTYKSTEKLEPSKKIYSQIEPINIEVISLDWKWLFIYPRQGIVTINKIVFPINTPIHFKITSNSVMNSFFIPVLGSQIYAMPGMQTKLNLIANYSGIYNGISANFSGSGFSKMKFKVIVVPKISDFNYWILNATKNSKNLTSHLKNIFQSSKNNMVEYFQCKNCKLFYQTIEKFEKT